MKPLKKLLVLRGYACEKLPQVSVTRDRMPKHVEDYERGALRCIVHSLKIMKGLP